MSIIDLRSDTVTKPTPGMLEAMFSAKVGDNVFNEDPTITALEQKTADLFGHEAGLFCPSGTMTNQVAIKTHTQPGDELICDQRSHIYRYEGGGVAFNAGVSMRLLDSPRGLLNADYIEENINDPTDIHCPLSTLISLENTCNKGGGSCYSFEEIQKISAMAKRRGLKLHLDGARLFNALIAKGETPKAHGALFDSISICLSKGLGAPVGSVLLGSKAFIAKALRWRKAFGGGMRQAGYLAAAGIYALDHHVNRLAEDHKRAQILGEELSKARFVKKVLPIETNIVIFEVIDSLNGFEVNKKFAENEVLVINFSQQSLRMVTHLDFNDEMLERTIQCIRTLQNSL